MKGFKAFGKGLICKGKQYAENTVFEEKEAEICKSGMHFCENPLDVLDYYPLVDENGEFVEVADVEALDECKTDDNKKYCTKKLKIGVKLSLAKFVKAAIDFAFEKNGSKLSTGNSAQLASSGDYARLASSGGYARLASSGDYARLASSGYNAVIAGIGKRNIAKGKQGSWLVLVEWGYDDEDVLFPVCVKTVQIDGEVIKEDTFYKLENGEFKEA
jgi:hypothetical protein